MKNYLLLLLVAISIVSCYSEEYSLEMTSTLIEYTSPTKHTTKVGEERQYQMPMPPGYTQGAHVFSTNLASNDNTSANVEVTAGSYMLAIQFYGQQSTSDSTRLTIQDNSATFVHEVQDKSVHYFLYSCSSSKHIHFTFESNSGNCSIIMVQAIPTH